VTCQVTRISHGSHCPTLWLGSSRQGERKEDGCQATTCRCSECYPRRSFYPVPNFHATRPPGLKRPRSTTVSSLPHIDEQFLRDAPPSAYFLKLFHKINQELEIGATTANKDTVVMIEIIYQIHKDYRSAIDRLSEQIEVLTEEIANTKEATPRPDTPTPIPFPLPTVAPSPATTSNIRPPPLPVVAQLKSWAPVARKGRKEKTTIAARAAQAPTKSTTNRP